LLAFNITSVLYVHKKDLTNKKLQKFRNLYFEKTNI